jgi:ABC-2 type transport system permease protein
MLKRFFDALWQKLIRTFAFVGREARGVLHQPRLVFSLILGPFLILLIFGLGYRNTPRTLRTLFVVPEGSRIQQAVEQYAAALDSRIEYAGITADADEADQLLRNQEVDLVVVTPADPTADWQNDQQSAFFLYHYEIDPVEEIYIRVLGQRYAEQVNEQLLLTAATQSQTEAQQWQTDVGEAKNQASMMRQALAAGNQAQAQQSATELKQEIDLLTVAVGSGLAIFAGMEGSTGNTVATDTILSRLQSIQENSDALAAAAADETALAEGEAKAAEIETALTELDGMLAEFRDMEPSVLVSPFRSETLTITNVQLEPMHFYVPAVIALLMQHLAVTLAGLSIIREKLGGAMELFRASPASAMEILFGKYLSYLLLISVVAAVLTLLVIGILNVPQLGRWAGYVVVILGVILASLGLGFHISLSARSDSQAIQLGMITLLAAIFFSGFFLPLYRLAEPTRIISWLLPATYGTVLLQDVMLRGQPPQLLLLLALYFFALVLFVLASWRLARQMRHE